jgi:hypothetical protein
METLQMNSGGAATEVKVADFKIVKDGKGFELKIANLDSPTWAPFQGVVKIEAIKPSKTKTRNTVIKTVNDRSTQSTFGIFLGVDRTTSDFMWEKIELHELEYFNLANPKERQRYIILSRHHIMEGSPNQFGRAAYRVIDQEKKAVNYIQERSARKKAMDIADNLTPDQMIELAPAFGIKPEANSMVMLQAEVLKIADMDHKKFLAVWDNPDRPGMVTFQKAMKLGLIKYYNESHRVGYYYEGQLLGQSEASAYKFLTDHVQLLTALNMIIKELESNTTHAFVPISLNKEDEYDKKMKALAEKEKELEEREKKLSTPKTELSDEEEYPGEKNELLEQAKSLGVKGAHLFNISKLRERIKEEHTKLHT